MGRVYIFGAYATYQMVSVETKVMMQVTTSLLESKRNIFLLYKLAATMPVSTYLTNLLTYYSQFVFHIIIYKEIPQQ